MGTFAFWRVPVAILLFGFISQVGFAQSPPSPISATPVRDPQAITIMQSAITAMGGAANIAQIQTAVIQGTSQSNDASASTASFVWTWAGTEFRMQNQAASGSHTTLSGHGNPVDVRDGTTVPMGQQLLRSELPFHIPAVAVLTVLNNTNYSITLVETITVDGKLASHVHASDDTDVTGQQVTPQEWYFDQGTGLPLRVEYRFPYDSDPSHWLACSTDFGNFQVINGVQVPFALSLAVSSYSAAATVTSAAFNVPIIPSQFDPSSVSAQ